MAKKQDNSNFPLIIAAVLGLAVAGGAGYFAGKASDAPAAPTSLAQLQNNQAQKKGDAPAVEIKPGNPVVAKVSGQDITRADVINFIQTLPPQTRQLPVEQLFPVALEQVITNYVIGKKAEGVDLGGDPLVQQQLDRLKVSVERDVYLQKQIEQRLTEERVKQAYDAYTAGFPEIEEVKARHILVKEKDVAKDLIAQLEGGADFAELAKANSTDGTAQSGGEIGYFAEAEVVPEFAKAAFALAPGEMTKKPVETQFGYHVIQVEEKRIRPPATYEEAKPFIEAQLRQVILNEIVQEWKQQAEIQRYDINGEQAPAPAGNQG